MIPIQQFVEELTSTFRYGTPLDCSRSELAVDESANMVMLLLRTKPSLSDWMLSSLPRQYPFPLLSNCDFVLFKVWRQIMKQRTVIPAASELMRAAMAGVPRGNFHGTAVDIGTFGMEFYVPDAAASPEWKAVLLDPQYPHLAEQGTSLPEFFVVHLPDVPIDQLNDAQLEQLATLSVGWNFLEVYSPDYIPTFAQAIRVAAAESAVIAEY